eukprot:TRINITY_DN11691_c0_g1_i2.p1 TRINITY_DN11691_c0_g1~~TRINITY_DN11691_c0_g1_i2.p1  ORF type:complete len:678 (+),score=155.32 TRINITY_DN11691_c0_g1_i2:752-2785(+)
MDKKIAQWYRSVGHELLSVLTSELDAAPSFLLDANLLQHATVRMIGPLSDVGDQATHFWEGTVDGEESVFVHGEIGASGEEAIHDHGTVAAALDAVRAEIQSYWEMGYAVESPDTQWDADYALLPSPFDEVEAYVEEHSPPPPLPVVWLELYRAKQSVVKKAQWWRKVRDPEVAARWRRELQSAGLLETQVEYALAELEYDAVHVDPFLGRVVTSPLHCVMHAPRLLEAPEDGNGSEDLRQSVRDMFRELEADLPIDWHPGSGEKVRNLVHPSLHCYVDGVTPVLEEPLPWMSFLGREVQSSDQKKEKKKKEETLGRRGVDERSDGTFVSERYQWIPSEVSVDGQSARFVSYINGLDPIKYGHLYSVLGHVLSRMLPLFGRTLGAALVDHRDSPFLPRVHISPYDLYPPEPEQGDMSDGAYDEMIMEYDPEPYPVPFDDTFDASMRPPPVVFGVDQASHLQVIVKLANIELTPEKPRYEGGVWHVEGMENEAIVASGIYYSDVENITESFLEFRRPCGEPKYAQNDDKGVWAMYGLADEAALSQHLGQVHCVAGAAYTWPNYLQHRVTPFELRDKTRPGHRRMLVFFLVDPSRAVRSTATCVPTRREWLESALIRGGVLESGLPREIVSRIVHFIPGWPIGAEEAGQHRAQLMHERKYVVNRVSSQVYERPFSLCEH